MDAFHVCFDWVNNCLRTCKRSTSCNWGEIKGYCNTFDDYGLEPDKCDPLDGLGNFLREDWNPSAWEQRLRELAGAYSQHLFQSPKLQAHYRAFAKQGPRLPVTVEHCVPNDYQADETYSLETPSEFWAWGGELALFVHPLFKRIRPEHPLTSYAAPILFPEIPDIILLIAGEPNGYGHPSANDMVDRIADIWERPSQKLAERWNKHPEVIKLHFEQASQSNIRDAIEAPLAQLETHTPPTSQPKRPVGLIHWVARTDVNQGQSDMLWTRGRDEHDLRTLSPGRLISFLHRARERNIHWQFFFLCSYRQEDNRNPMSTLCCSPVIEPLILKGGVPSVLGFRRPVWRGCADNLAADFYSELLASYYDPRLPERDIPQAIFQIRKDLHQNVKDGIEPCYYSWASPLLVMQQAEEEKVSEPRFSIAPVHTEDTQYIASNLAYGRCCSLVGPSKIGKSSLLKSLLKDKTIEALTHRKSNPLLTVWVNCLEAEENEQAFYELLLRRILEKLRDIDVSKPLLNALETAHYEMLDAIAPVAAWARFASSVRRLTQESDGQLVLLLDEFDDVFRRLPPVTFRHLRALRDAPGIHLCYVTATSHHLRHLRDDAATQDFRELFDLCTVMLTPLSEEDCRRFIAYLEETQRDSLNSDYVSQIIELSGGHPGLLERIYHLVTRSQPPPALEPAPLADEMLIQQECQRLWDEMKKEEREGLASLVKNGKTFPTDIKPLKDKGLIVERGSGRLALFSPVFEAFVQQLDGYHNVTPSALRYDEATGQIWQEERNITQKFSELQYRLIECLLQRPGEVCTKDEIADAVWPEAHGAISDAQISQLVKRIREKIEPDPYNPTYIATVRGRGYRLKLNT